MGQLNCSGQAEGPAKESGPQVTSKGPVRKARAASGYPLYTNRGP